MSDHRALIEEASEHRELADSKPEFRSECESCDELWPCLTARLAEALEQARDEIVGYRIAAETDGNLNENLTAMLLESRGETAAAQARTERLAGALECLLAVVGERLTGGPVWIGCGTCRMGCIRRTDGKPVPNKPSYAHKGWCPVPDVAAALDLAGGGEQG